MLRKTLLILMLVLGHYSWSQTSEEDISDLPWTTADDDKNSVLDEDRWRELKASEDLLYTKEIKGRKKSEKESSGDANAKKEKQQQQEAGEPIIINIGRVGQIIVVVLFVVLLGALLYLLVGNELFGRKNKKLTADEINALDIETEMDPESDLQRMLKEAIRQNNLRLVIRIYFIMIIKHMDEVRLIRWKKEKTNRDYMYELDGSPYHDGFVRLSRWYDLIWYGEKLFSEEDLKTLSEDFSSFQNELKRNN
ncbi:MAG: hypothetical protein ABJF11_03420 [Reichenbachiella sp.]|uniref:hypothetical protein n=1 Tax=Reichenbachiella sp. TaxID=2184521 RepID=UPI003263399D